jgi:hypothetical protein
MNKQLLLVLTGIFFSFQIYAMAPATKKDFMGEWKFNIQNAPYGYQQGTIFIGENNNTLTGEVRFSDGNKIKMENMVIANGTLQFRIFADSEYVNAKLSVEGNKLKGAAITSEGEIRFEATKAETNSNVKQN